MKSKLRKVLFFIARIKIMGVFVGFVIAHFPSLLPVTNVAVNKNAVSFNHPVPSYKNHMLIIPRKIVENIFHLTGSDFIYVLQMAAEICASRDSDYVLLINGGRRQDVMQAHFHLFEDESIKIISDKHCVAAALISDKHFWDYFADSLYQLLNDHNVTTEAFSVIFKFDGSEKVQIYFS